MTDIRDDFEAALEATDAWDFSEVDGGLIDDILAALAARGLTVVRAPREDTRLVEVTTEVMDAFGARTSDGRRLSYVWGEPDRGVYELVLMASDDGFTVVREGESLDAAWAEAEAALPEGAHATMTWPTLTEGRRYVVAALRPSEGGYGSETLGNGWGDTPAEALRALVAALTRQPEGQ
jgi:hypothetical protein